MERNQSAPRLLVLWLAAAVSIGTLASFGYSYLRDNELRFAAIESDVQGTLQRLESQQQNSGEWKQRTINNERQLLNIATNAFAREDPFTGTQGEKLERRIDELERSCERINYIDRRVDDLAIRLRENEGYYRRQVLPLIEQSNSLQQQHIQQNRMHEE